MAQQLINIFLCPPGLLCLDDGSIPILSFAPFSL